MRKPRLTLHGKKEYAIAVGLGIAAFTLRAIGLGDQSLWSDEIGTVLVAQKPVLDLLWFVLLNDINPPGFYLLLHVWMWVGQSEFFLRLLPCLVGSATPPLVFLIVRKIYSEKIGLAAAIFLTFSPLHIYYSQELRYQTILAFISALSWYFFHQHLKKPDRAKAVCYTITTAAGCYLHYTFLLMLIAQAVYLFFDRRNFYPKARPFKWVGFAGLAFLPGALMAAFQFLKGNALIKSYAVGTGIHMELWDAVAGLVATQSPKRPATLIRVLDECYMIEPVVFRILFLVITIPIFFLFVLGVDRLRKNLTGRMFLFYFFVPFTGLLLLSIVASGFETKLLVPILPPFFVIIGAGVLGSTIRLRATGIIASIWICGIFLLSFYQMNSDARYHRDDWRGLARWIENQEKKGDALVNFSFEMEYYYKGGLRFENIASTVRDISMSEDQIAQWADSLKERYKRLWVRTPQLDSIRWMNLFTEQLQKNTVALTQHDAGRFGIPFALLATSVTPIDERIAEFATPVIDFGNPSFDQRQLDGFWLMTDDGWAWASNSAKAFVKMPPDANSIFAEVFVNTDLLPGNTTEVRLLVDGIEKSRQRVNSPSRIKLSAPHITGQGVVCVKIISDKSIIQDERESVPLHQKRTMLVQKIEAFFSPSPLGKDSDF